MPEGSEPVKHGMLSKQWQPPLAAAVLALLWMMQPAQGKCLSPSAESGATATTVYRCPEQEPSTAKQPILVNPEKTTVVERGSSDEPWFAPKPLEKKVEPALAPDIKPIEADKPVIKPDEADKPIIKPVKAKKKTVVKTKLASKKRIEKRAEVKRTKARTAKIKPVKNTPKVVGAKSDDDKVIVWTKKDMPLGSRIVNWLGF